MTDDEARAWLATYVPRETIAVLESLIAIVIDEMARQNLIAASTVDHIWTRHVVDSAQLLPLAPAAARSWIDLGSGAGFPGMVVAAMRPDMRVTLVESRRKRIDFLESMAVRLGLADRVTVAGTRLETLETAPYDVISARAFAPIDRLLPLAHRFSTPGTVWLLPKGRSAVSELEAAETSWQGSFRIEQSVTDSEAAIIVAQKVQPMTKRERAERKKAKGAQAGQ
jgi:16S rRNA (guanine527-N7)-methyltransferase